MNRIRTILLTTIGIVTSAWVGLDALRHRAEASASPQPSPSGSPGNSRNGKATLPPLFEKQKIGAGAGKSNKNNPAPEAHESSSAPGANKPQSDLSKVHGEWGYLKELYNRFNEDYCGQWAAALSFFALLSIAPILLCALAVLGFVIHDADQAVARVQEIIQNLLPGAGAQKAAQQLIVDMHIKDSAQALVKGKVTSLIIGGLSLLWGALQIFANAMTPMNAAFRAKETRNFFMQRVIALGLLVVVGALFIVSLLPSVAANFVDKLPGFEASPAILQWLVGLLLALLGVAINAVMFTITYRYLPSPTAKVTWKEAAVAGGIVAVLWEIAKLGFGLYLSNFPKYSAIYGALGGLFVLVIWIYYSSMILLLGAEIANLYGDYHAKKAKAENSPPAR